MWEIQGSIPAAIPAYVRATKPEPDNWVRPGQTIVILPGVRLGDYRGRNASQALAELSELGYRTGPLARRKVENRSEGKVLAQNPPPGIVAYGSIVYLTMAVAPSPNWIPFAVGGGLIALVTGLLVWFKIGSVNLVEAKARLDSEPERPAPPSGVSFRPRLDAGRQSVTSGPEAKDGKGFSIRIHGDSGTQRVVFPHDPASSPTDRSYI